jgi:hypothetical protein
LRSDSSDSSLQNYEKAKGLDVTYTVFFLRREQYIYHSKSLQTLPYFPYGKSKAIPVQAWRGPEVYRMMRFPDFKTIGT